RFSEQQNKDLLIVVDTSASMFYGNGSNSRMEQAKEIARDRVRSMGLEQSAILATIADDMNILVHRTTYPQDLLEGIELLSPSYSSFNEHALKDFFKHAHFQEKFQLILISDGCLPKGALPAGCEHYQVGEPCENAGIIAFDADWVPGKLSELEFFVKWFSNEEQPAAHQLTIRYGEEGQIIKVIALDDERKEDELNFRISGAQEGLWSVEINDEQGHVFDNKVHAFLHAPKPLKVALSGKNLSVLSACVRSFEQTNPGMLLVPEDPEVVIYATSQMMPEPYPGSRATIVFSPRGQCVLWEVEEGDAMNLSSVKCRLPNHPYLKYLETDLLELGGVRPLKAPAHAVVILESLQGVPLVYSIKHNHYEYCVVNCDPSNSSVFLNTAFPILVYSLAQHHAKRDDLLQSTYAPNSIRDWVGYSPSWFDPSGQELSAQSLLEEGAQLMGVYSAASKSGNALEGGGGKQVALSFLSPLESLDDVIYSQVADEKQASFWSMERVLIWLALLILLAEFVSYHRRWVG
ncbi:MAG: VWA domain-containing protein, partial [Planctomycetes bacterium]|nr:VWA domain-containing protein [Planctomycetota bacterium]